MYDDAQPKDKEDLENPADSPKDEKGLEAALEKDTAHLVDETLLNLNEEIKDAFDHYFKGTAIKIRFDIPDKTDPPNDPTLCVFLYDIQEDLELRHGQPRAYNVATQRFAPGQVHVRCCYLITYWESKNIPEASMGPRSQSMLVMNLVLNALLNLKLTQIMPTFKRVIAPSEHLSSLGNFWQALDNKPRLCLNFAVTVPITLATEATDTVNRVVQLSTQIATDVKPAADLRDVASALRESLVSALREKCEPNATTGFARAKLDAQLGSLSVQCEADPSSKPGAPVWQVAVSGALEDTLWTPATTIVDGWTTTWPLSAHPGQSVSKVDRRNLMKVDPIPDPQ